MQECASLDIGVSDVNLKHIATYPDFIFISIAKQFSCCIKCKNVFDDFDICVKGHPNSSGFQKMNILCFKGEGSKWIILICSYFVSHRLHFLLQNIKISSL